MVPGEENGRVSAIVALPWKEEASVVEVFFAVFGSVEPFLLFFAIDRSILELCLHARFLFLLLDLEPVSGLFGILVEILNLTHLQHHRNAELVHFSHLLFLEVSNLLHGLVHVHLDLSRLRVKLLSLALKLMHMSEDLLTMIVEVKFLVPQTLDDVDLKVTVS